MKDNAWKISKEIKAEIGARVRELRKSKGLSQAEFAELLDREQNQISRIESGENLLSTELLLRMRDLFGADVKYILTGETAGGVNPKLSRFISWYDTVEPNIQIGAAKVCEGIVETYASKTTGE